MKRREADFITRRRPSHIDNGAAVWVVVAAGRGTIGGRRARGRVTVATAKHATCENSKYYKAYRLQLALGNSNPIFTRRHSIAAGDRSST